MADRIVAWYECEKCGKFFEEFEDAEACEAGCGTSVQAANNAIVPTLAIERHTKLDTDTALLEVTFQPPMALLLIPAAPSKY